MHATQLATPDAAGLAAYVLRDTRLVCLRSMLPLINAEAPVQWLHVAMTGSWVGHHSGEFAFSRESFEAAVRNHERRLNAIKLDFDHETDFLPPGSSVPARGWIHRLEIRDDEQGRSHLWALTEFGPEAVQKNRAGGYRFCSGVFDFNATDRATGEPLGLVLQRVALTDDPFLEGQSPLVLSSAAAIALNGVSMKIDKAEFVRRLRKLEGEEVTPEQIAQLAQAMGLMAEATGGGSGESKEAPEEPAAMSATEPVVASDAPPAAPVEAAAEPPAEGAPDAAAQLAQLLEAAGVASFEELLQMLAGMGGQMPAAPAPLSANRDESAVILASTKKALSDVTKERDDAVKALSAYREREADTAVAVLVESGRLLDTGRDFARSLYLSNRESFDAFAAALPDAVPVGEHASKDVPPTAETPAIDESDEYVKRRRRQLSNTWLPKAEQDAAIRRELAARKNNGVRV